MSEYGALCQVPSGACGGICIEDIETVELQLKHPTCSRTVWIIVPEGQFHIPCGLPDFKAFKQ